MQQHQRQQEEQEQGLDYDRHWDLLSVLRALRYRATLPGRPQLLLLLHGGGGGELWNDAAWCPDAHARTG